jgi:hypothetical protein
MIDTFEVSKVAFKDAKVFVKSNHYSGSIAGAACYGLFDAMNLIGVCAFAAPVSENVRASIFGIEYKDRVMELHRLVLIDDTPKNTESWFISRALKAFKKDKPNIWAIVSFADPRVNHRGIIYQATNALFTGSSNKARFFIDQNGKVKHQRYDGKNISTAEGIKRGWKSIMMEGKYRYLYLLPDDRKHLKELKKMLLLEVLPYPKEKIA